MSQGSMPTVPFRDALRFWFKLGFISFGGPAGQIAILHEELVDKRRWVDEERFQHALSYCMFLPGPEAQQLATYIGWLLHGTRGGIVAGTLFVLPSVFILFALSWMYAEHGDVAWVASILFGLQAVVIAIVAHAVLRIGKKALKNAWMFAIAAAAFVALYVFGAPFPAVIAAAAAIGWIGGKLAPRYFLVIRTHAASSAAAVAAQNAHGGGWRRAVKVLALCLFLWWTPVVLAGLVFGWNSVFVTQGTFFSKAAMVTFGGAYAVLPYVAREAVGYGWLAQGEMQTGIGLAETTPGPLIMVLQFVGFLGGWHHPGELPPLLAATLCALITTWVTFLPCFLWIFLGAPYVERMRGVAGLTAALSAITAAVVGVVLNLAVVFGRGTLFPAGGGFSWLAAAIAVAGFVALTRFAVGVVPLVLGAGVLGLIARLVAP